MFTALKMIAVLVAFYVNVDVNLEKGLWTLMWLLSSLFIMGNARHFLHTMFAIGRYIYSGPLFINVLPKE